MWLVNVLLCFKLWTLGKPFYPRLLCCHRETPVALLLMLIGMLLFRRESGLQLNSRTWRACQFHRSWEKILFSFLLRLHWSSLIWDTKGVAKQSALTCQEQPQKRNMDKKSTLVDLTYFVFEVFTYTVLKPCDFFRLQRSSEEPESIITTH